MIASFVEIVFIILFFPFDVSYGGLKTTNQLDLLLYLDGLVSVFSNDKGRGGELAEYQQNYDNGPDNKLIANN